MRYRKFIKRAKFKKKNKHSSKYKKYVKIKKVPVACRERSGVSPGHRALLILSITVPLVSLVVFKLVRHFLNKGTKHVRYRRYSPLRFASQG